ncbi:MAG TPA: hypothetical protein VEY67_02290 [Candidatus Dormibacteraeota bacterium]|nr:hypothetical protein [Candidatus Dormibacteraeota bacterium]
MRRIRGLLIAITALALSAGAAFAALPRVAGIQLVNSTQVGQQGDEPSASTEPSESPEASESPDPSETPEASESPDPSESPDAAQPAASGAQGEHGALVSEAAQGPTPSGWPNHGAYVSAVARGDAQPGDPAPAGLTTHGKQHHGQPPR